MLYRSPPLWGGGTTAQRAVVGEGDNCVNTYQHTFTLTPNWIVRTLPKYELDFRFFTFHELRHVHQKKQIFLRRNGEEVVEDISTIDLWEYETKNYITNCGDVETQEANLNQEIERDANAYAYALINMFFIE